MIPKFRAWHKQYKQMLTPHLLAFDKHGKVITIYFNPADNWSLPHPDIELMQWTGLQDSDAVDIYEGDIVCSESDEGYTCEKVIRLSSGLYMLECIYSGEQCTDLESCVDSIEVMGNIYENSNLLQG